MMHIDTDKALAWLDQLREGVENSNCAAEEVVTRCMNMSANPREGTEMSETKLPLAEFLYDEALKAEKRGHDLLFRQLQDAAAVLGQHDLVFIAILDHLGTALVQALPSDDQIIIGHIRSAHKLAAEGRQANGCLSADAIDRLTQRSKPEPSHV